MRIFSIVFLCAAPLAVLSPKCLAESNDAKAGIRTGHFSTTFDQLSDLASYTELVKRIIGESEAQSLAIELSKPENTKLSRHPISLSLENYEIFVPETYDPTIPFGLIVYISPGDQAEPPRSFQRVLDELNLIYVAANNSGNDHSPIDRRIPLALHAVSNMSAIYNIDPKRVYISGFSGGAKVAGYLGILYSDVFKGALYICGSLPLGNRGIRLPLGKSLTEVKQNSRFVFLTGKKDFNHDEIKRHFRQYKRLGFTNTALIDNQLMTHELPNESQFRRAIEQLDIAR